MPAAAPNAFAEHVRTCWHCAHAQVCPVGQRLQAEAAIPARVLSLVPRQPSTLTPVELLEAFVADVKAGKIKPEAVAIHWHEQLGDGRRRPECWHANMTYAELIAFCELHKRLVIHDWIES